MKRKFVNSELVARENMKTGDCFTKVWKHYARPSKSFDAMYTGICGISTKKGEKIWGIINPPCLWNAFHKK